MNDENVNGEMATTHEATMGLRFVERAVPAPELGEGVARKVRILQQMFVPKNWHAHDVEWRDVPLSDG